MVLQKKVQRNRTGCQGDRYPSIRDLFGSNFEFFPFNHPTPAGALLGILGVATPLTVFLLRLLKKPMAELDPEERRRLLERFQG